MNINQRGIYTPKDIVGLLSKEDLSRLHRVSAWKGIAYVGLEWTYILSLVVLCERFFSIPLYLLVWALIGGRWLGLGILMHEAVHGLLHPNKRLNEIIGEVLCAWPILVSLRSYRQKHLAHHRWVNTDRDPDFVGKSDMNWTFPMSKAKLWRILIIQLIGLGTVSTFRNMSNSTMPEAKVSRPLGYNVVRVSYYATVLGALVWLGFGTELLLYWLLPLLTWTQFANRLRRIAEHSAVDGLESEFQTRTTLHGFLSKVFLVPNNINYHNEHHLLPGVPWYRLPDVFAQFQKHAQAREVMHTTKSYSGVFNEVLLEDEASSKEA